MEEDQRALQWEHEVLEQRFEKVGHSKLYLACSISNSIGMEGVKQLHKSCDFHQNGMVGEAKEKKQCL